VIAKVAQGIPVDIKNGVIFVVHGNKSHGI